MMAFLLTAVGTSIIPGGNSLKMRSYSVSVTMSGSFLASASSYSAAFNSSSLAPAKRAVLVASRHRSRAVGASTLDFAAMPPPSLKPLVATTGLEPVT